MPSTVGYNTSDLTLDAEFSGIEGLEAALDAKFHSWEVSRKPYWSPVRWSIDAKIVEDGNTFSFSEETLAKTMQAAVLQECLEPKLAPFAELRTSITELKGMVAQLMERAS